MCESGLESKPKGEGSHIHAYPKLMSTLSFSLEDMTPKGHRNLTFYNLLLSWSIEIKQFSCIDFIFLDWTAKITISNWQTPINTIQVLLQPKINTMCHCHVFWAPKYMIIVLIVSSMVDVGFNSVPYQCNYKQRVWTSYVIVPMILMGHFGDIFNCNVAVGWNSRVKVHVMFYENDVLNSM